VPGPRPNWPQAAEPRDEVHEAIERALAVPVEIDVTEVSLADVLEQLGQRYGVQVEIDRPALEDEGVILDALVTRRIRNVPLRSLLRLLLADYGLDYVIRDEVLAVTMPGCEPLDTIKIYPVFDLVCRAGGEADEGAGLDYQAVIEGLTACVAPTTWDAVGGPGEIKVFEPAGALVISQTAAVHEEIARYLKALRDVAAR
jgi:hypothetical protein